MCNISKTKFRKQISKAIMLHSKAGVDYAFNVETENGTKVQVKYVMACLNPDKNQVWHTFTMIDLNDPWSHGPHGYPKMYEGDIDAFYEEFKRELDYINSIHLPKSEKKFINIETYSD